MRREKNRNKKKRCVEKERKRESRKENTREATHDDDKAKCADESVESKGIA